MKKYILAIAALALSSLVHAQFSGTDYNTNDVRRAMPAQTAVVIDVVTSEVAVSASGTSRTVGAAAAGLACGAGTRKMSDWQSRTAVIGLCALAGERAGAIFSSETRKASTLVVKLSTGAIMGVAQEDPNIRVGSQVYVLQAGGETRVILVSSPVVYGR